MKKVALKFLAFALLLSFSLAFFSCEGEEGSLSAVEKIAAAFPLKYGEIYSDELSDGDARYFTDEMKTLVLGENAMKYDFIVSVSGYFSRDRVSAEEVIVIQLDDRSHRAEITAALYRRASKKQDVPTGVLCQGDLVYFICASNPERIIEYIKTKM